MVRERARAGDLHIPTDNELAGRAARGDVAAFDELYRRHAEAAWRVGQAVAANPHDAADAVADAFVQIFQALPLGRIDPGVPFRPYLLAATRNAAIDTVRRRARLYPTELAALDTATVAPGPSERVEAGEERALVAEAFRGLPERWRSVLWLTEVEGMPARDAAPVMGLSPNGVAQLALRARAGLRRNYLQAHVRNGVARRCRWTVDHLGAYVAGALARRDLAKVEQHLERCDACRARLAELEDLGSTLRGVLLPIPLGLGAMALGKWRLAAHTTRRATDPARRALSGASAALAVLGVLGLLLLPRVDDRLRGPLQRSPAVPTGPRTVQLAGAAPAPAATPSGAPARAQGAALLPGPTAFPLVPPGGGGGPPPSPPPSPPPPPGPGPGPPGPIPPGGVPVVEVTLSGALGPSGAGAAAGLGDGSCTAIAFEPSADGCIATPRQDPGVRAEASGQAFPQPVVISVP